MKLFCGHRVPDSVYFKMAKTHQVRCPKCCLQWRGWMVIQNDKQRPKQDLRFAAQAQRNRDR